MKALTGEGITVYAQHEVVKGPDMRANQCRRRNRL